MAEEQFPYTDGQTYTHVPPEKRPQVPTPVVPDVTPGTGIPDNAFDNPFSGPTHTGGGPIPHKGK